MGKERIRSLEIDNMKGILICLVVFGHLCSTTSNANLEFIYNVIYLFHMPAFAFISGFCCSKNEKVITGIKKYIFPYIPFQLLYILYLGLLSGEKLTIQFYVPLWHLWYLVALFFWHLIIRFFDVQDTKKKVFLLVVSVLAALLFGYDNLFSRFLCLSRTVVLFPFFLTGYYLKGKEIFRMHNKKEKGALFILTFAVIFAMYFFRNQISSTWLHHQNSYAVGNYNMGIRFLILLSAAIIILFLCMNIPNKKIPLLTNAGIHSMSIFLLHGIIVFAYRYIKEAKEICDQFPILLLLITFLTVYLLSRKPIVNALNVFLKIPFKIAPKVKVKE